MKTEVENERQTRVSKCLGNILRYHSFMEYRRLGLDHAQDWLKTNIVKCKSYLDDGKIKKIQNGIIAELRFFDYYRTRFDLCPTLDAGCACDFVGKLPENDNDFEKLRFGGDFFKIDVTTSIDCKRNKTDVLSWRGQSDRPLLFAHVQDNIIEWYDEKLDSSILCDDKLKYSTFSGDKDVQARHRNLFVRHRREKLEMIEKGQKITAVLNELENTNSITEEEKKIIEVHARFFAMYKYALNIVPALSCGDWCDFVGEHAGNLVRYRVLVDNKRYYEDERSVFGRLSQEAEYKIAVFNAQSGIFDFYDWDAWQLNDDIPEFENEK